MSSDREAFLQALQSIDPYEFESLIADLWEEQGWETEVTSGSNDRGIDVIATREMPFQQKVALQIKRYDPTNTIGSPDIQQYASLRQQIDNLDAVIVVTTAEFTSGATELAESLNVKLIDGDRLYELFEEYAVPDMLDDYREDDPVDDSTGIVTQSDPASPTTQADESDEIGTGRSAQPVETDGDVRVSDEPTAPTSLSEVISLSESLSDDVTALTETIERADDAFERRAFGDALELYGDAQAELLTIRPQVDDYETGFESVDAAATRHLTGPAEFRSELKSLREHITNRLNKADDLREQADALETLAREIESDAEAAVGSVDEGDRARNRGDYDAAVDCYEAAAASVDEAYATLETYRALREEYPRALPETASEPPTDIDLDTLETKVNDRLQDGSLGSTTAADPVESMHESVKTTLLEETYRGQGETVEAPESYLDSEEVPHFVFYSSLKGHTIEDEDGSKDRKRPDNEYGSVFVITEKRVLTVTGTDSGDEVTELSLPVRAEYSTGWSKNRLTLYPDFLPDGRAHHLWIDSEYDEADLEEAVDHLIQAPDQDAYGIQGEMESAIAESLPDHLRDAIRTAFNVQTGDKPYLSFDLPTTELIDCRILIADDPTYSVGSADTELIDRAVAWANGNDFEIEFDEGGPEDVGPVPVLNAEPGVDDPDAIAAQMMYFFDKVCGISQEALPQITAELVNLADSDQEGITFERSEDDRSPEAAAGRSAAGGDASPTVERNIDTGVLALKSTDEQVQWVEETVSAASNDTVTREGLLGDPAQSSHDGLFDDPPLAYLREDERVEYLLSTRGSYGFSIGEKGNRTDPSADGRAFHVITDERVISLVGQDTGDATLAIPRDTIRGAQLHTGISKFRIELAADGETYHLWVSNSFDVDLMKDVVDSLY